jgi:hypothetical protein
MAARIAKLGVVVAAVAATLASAVAAAGAQPVPLPRLGHGLPGQPPLVGKGSRAERFFRGKLEVRERVVVGVDRAGAAISVHVRQRIVLVGKGDYRLAVPGPIDDVQPAPGGQTQPGLRQDALLWAGFSPGRRVLDAVARLRLADSAPYLPLQLAVVRTGSTIVLTIQNRTTASFPALVADPRPQDIARILDDLRASLDGGRAFRDLSVPAAQPGYVEQFSVTAAFSIKGTLSAGGRTMAIDGVVGARRRMVRVAGVAPGATPRVELVATPVAAPVPRSGVASGADLMRLADRTLLALELTREYAEFLESPPRRASAATVYVYGTERRVTPAAAPVGRGGSGVLAALLAGVLGVLGLGALAVVWARS